MVQDVDPSSFAKSAGEFGDTQILNICETAFDFLKELVHAIYTVTKTIGYGKPLLNLMIKCSSYDFHGTSAEEYSDIIHVLPDI